ncbi:MAG TPA: hypothetical protein DEG17_00215 [Cyanobacteria bacterium UBA11149]|nr:hypothetical protein [Cyanobacteria bacterium UBA11367]HBE59653.1 hypothetical protein [Cyanobacteria bacterium UBA11366]HBK66162.1 hypothetical protein [Cyanobacteria bacterium UBA11166]HBR75836.1 hypothetical protein [Cyanobacteria bacterium UBA11159]HBS72563.1 hypothetical protein [Cyanobacteria bacterium UBA11153]HBW87345.1 hypothetical protein [Cyanobacteria bacterium UBA11149]HCA97569.1 hypothetical protein [Cyanobacteria bacterium UBA9226]
MNWQKPLCLIAATTILIPHLPVQAEPLSDAEEDRIMEQAKDNPFNQFLDGIASGIACDYACKLSGKFAPACSVICGGITNINWDKVYHPFADQKSANNTSYPSQIIHLDPVYIKVNPNPNYAQTQPDTIFTPSGQVYDKTGTWSGIPNYSNSDSSDWVNSSPEADMIFTPSGEVYEKKGSY